jgi:hypothetical protein
MQNRDSHNDLSPVDRLLRDLNAVGRLSAAHVPVTERLRAELGDDLFAVLQAEMASFDAGAFPLESHTLRVA